MELLRGKAAIVTGASRGIGLGIAKALLAEGYAVLLCGVTEEPRATADIAPELTRLGTWAYLRCDVSDAQDREALFAGMQERFGRLDVLVNNAGVAPVQRLDVLETTAESFERLLRVNTESCFFMCQAGARRMLAGKAQGIPDYRPRIINISSVSAYASSPSRGEYCVSKAGISMVTKLFADRLAGEGIPVFEVRPGIIQTDMTAGVADKYRRMGVRTNADTPRDAKKARELGAEGIGLCRTEHMFFDPERIAAFREMICSDTVEEREAALAKIMPYQQGDFEALYEALEGCPVCIRFLDPPLHEFVPTEEKDIEELAAAQGKSVEKIKNIIASLHEFNPMMGHRGCRLTVTYPEIAKMQTRAVIRAAINVSRKHPDWKIVPEIMIPLVGDDKELKFVKKTVVETADEEIKAAGSDLKYEVGTMIEIPRAALTADEIAKDADFFCFGTNDLTQMTFGFSRDDAGKFLTAYYDTKIYENDPFAKLDQVGVGKLMEMAIKLGRASNPKLHVGICGEHGGDPSSVAFCDKIGLDYVSCSPFRVPIARLAAAQAAIAHKKN